MFTNFEACPVFAVSLNVEKQLFSNIFIQMAYWQVHVPLYHSFENSHIPKE